MITNITAYNIDGEYYLHPGKPNGNTKKKIQLCIKKNQEAIERGKAQKTIHSYSFVDGWEEEEETSNKRKQNNKKSKKITYKNEDKISWQQLTLLL